MPTISIPTSARSRQDIYFTARGLIAESTPWGAIALTSPGAIPTTGTTTGTMVMSLLALKAGETVTNLVCFVGTQGTSLTFAKLGLFDSAGNFLKATAESSATFNSGTGFRSVALTGGTYTATADGGYYVGYLQFGNGATGATLIKAGATTNIGTQIGTGARVSGQVATQSDISGNVTIADSGNVWWFGVS